MWNLCTVNVKILPDKDSVGQAVDAGYPSYIVATGETTGRGRSMSDILCGGNGIRRCVSAFGAVGNKGRALFVPTGDLSILRTWKTVTETHLLLFAIPTRPNKG